MKLTDRQPGASATRPWLAAYPPGVPHTVDTSAYRSLAHMLEHSFEQYADRPAYVFMGTTFDFQSMAVLSAAFAAYLQSLGLAKGDRVAIMMPNVPQYPVVVAAVLRAGLVVVNVNPLYTARELQHQLIDAGAAAIVILENFAHTLEQCMAATAVRHVVVAAIGDLLGPFKGRMANLVVRQVKKLVPPFRLARAVRFNQAIRAGRTAVLRHVPIESGDIALLQYTGGTTGVAKGAALSHSNILANVLQSEAWNEPVLRKVPAGEQVTTVCALPLYHIFAFTVGMMLSCRIGGKLILIPNPRDLKAVLKELSTQTFHNFPAVNTLFNGLVHHQDFDTVDWSNLKVCVGGGTAVQSAVAHRWLERTGCPICEGYGLSEASPTASCNPADSMAYTGTIGVPLPGTLMKCIDEHENEVGIGERGEIAIKGPQVMAGYWQRADENARVFTADGYFKTGDVGIMDAQGFFRIVDRQKDMILVSGFNVYPNEIEEVVAMLPEVLECAVVGVPDGRTGEGVKLFIVKRSPALTTEAVVAHCRANLTGYKQPKYIEFRESMPKTAVGKILRRELR